MKLNRNKLHRVNVPETFFQFYLKPVPKGKSSAIDKLRSITPTPRGPGLTRVIPEVTYAEWEDLYQRAAAARARIKGAKRDTELVPAMSAEAMAKRMELLGVLNQVPYSTPGIPRPRKPRPIELDDDIDDIAATVTPPAVPVIPTAPLVLEVTSDVDEVEDEELRRFRQDLAL